MVKYKQIAQSLIQYIETEGLQADDKLPSINNLVDQYGVSKNTILSALKELEMQGLIYQVRGSGVYVRGHSRKGYINFLDLQGFNSMLSEFDVQSKVLVFEEIIADQNICEYLKLPTDQETPIYHVKRIRYIEGRPFCVEDSYFVKEEIPGLTEAIAKTSIFDYLTEDLEQNLGYADLFLRVNRLKADEADYLGLKAKDPCLRVEGIHHLYNGVPFDYSEIVYHFEETQFFIQGTAKIS